MTPDRALWLVALAAFVMHVRWSIQDWQSRQLDREYAIACGVRA